MRVAIDIEANSLTRPTKIWLVVCKDIDTGIVYIFRDVHEKPRPFLDFSKGVHCYIGHHILGYDLPVLRSILGEEFLGTDYGNCNIDRIVDTLVVSKLVDFPRKGHSIEDYGEEFGLEKSKFNDFTQWSQELEDRCVGDVEICHRIYLKYRRCILSDTWAVAIATEQAMGFRCGQLSDNGFYFNTGGASKTLSSVEKDLGEIDVEIEKAFPPREELIREFTPKATKFGTINKSSVPRALIESIHEYEIGRTYRHTRMVDFNPSSHKQLIDVLAEAGWNPVEKTKTHVEVEREINRFRYQKDNDLEVDIGELRAKLLILEKYGWRVNEKNLDTLPPNAPAPARALAKRILLESRRRTLTEWLGLVDENDRIHGRFTGLGAWTHRMSHQNPNTANIPSEFNINGTKKLLGKELRKLWRAPRNRLLVGVDAEGIQLRIFAHYINDPEFTQALVEGKKDDKTDPHSLNQRILGSVCRTRAAAKRFVFALLLGAGIGKLTEILECTESEAKEALAHLIERYTGFAKLRSEVIPKDAKRGWFIGLDGRRVIIPGASQRDRSHLCMSGYLQNGEAIVMKMACLLWHDMLEEAGITDFLFVNFVHDEWQTECPNNMDIAIQIAKIQCDSIRIVGERLGLNCPLAGSYYNDDHKDYTIGTNWYQTH